MSYIGNQPSSVAFLTDTFNGTGSQTAYTLSAAPANTSSILVAVSGVLQDPSTYGVTGLTLNFSAAPPSGTGNISVRYLGIPASGVTTTAYRTVTEFTATAGQTSFSVPSYTVGFVDVYRSGIRLGTADYTATTGTTVVLANGATAGDLISVESFLVSSVLNAIPATVGAINDTYLNTNSVTTAKIADANITTAKVADANITQAKLASGVAGTGPAFSAYQSSGQTPSATTWTKVQFQTEEFDTNNNFDNTTNYRFTPTVAGYYQLSSLVNVGANISGAISIYKNGSNYKQGLSFSSAGTVFQAWSVTSLVYFNGSTDYAEIYIYLSSSQTTQATAPQTYFNGSLVRAA